MVDLNRKILRHSLRERLSHWLVALTFFMTALSGLAFFFADFAWLAEVLGTAQIARIVHPFSGCVMILAFFVLFFTYWRDNVPKKDDFRWLFKVVDVLKGNEHHVADVGHYNMGQKLLFWTMLVALIILLVTGVMMWQPYFANEFSIPARRVAILLHAVTAIAFILGIMVHIYMAFWVKGSITGMVEGKVSARWAKKHHPRWFREHIKPALEAEAAEKAKSEAVSEKA